jgi:hypothetical protein
MKIVAKNFNNQKKNAEIATEGENMKFYGNW